MAVEVRRARRQPPGHAVYAVAAGLGVTAVAAWLAVVRSSGSSMDHEPAAPAFVGAWTVMMAAMMLPAAAPFVLLYGKGAPLGRTGALVGGYLAVWAMLGVPALLLERSFGDAPALAVAAVLAAAGLYQLTPLKGVCLRHCRSPVAFLLEHWRPGARGALALGVRHGAWCAGCCWALMAVLVAAGAMSLVWVAAIAVTVFAEKVLPRGETTARVAGLALLALGVAVALDPDLAFTLSGKEM